LIGIIKLYISFVRVISFYHLKFLVGYIINCGSWKDGKVQVDVQFSSKLSPATVTANHAVFSTRNLQFSFQNMSILVTCCKFIRNLAASSKRLAWKPDT